MFTIFILCLHTYMYMHYYYYFVFQMITRIILKYNILFSKCACLVTVFELKLAFPSLDLSFPGGVLLFLKDLHFLH